MAPKICPVIHLLDRDTALEQVTVARQCGAHGVFLISHLGGDDELIDIASDCVKAHPDFPIGINLLSKTVLEAARSAHSSGIRMVWADDMGVNSQGLTAAGRDVAIWKMHFPAIELFASVAFKYQPYEPNAALAAQNAQLAGFIPTTSGKRTGSPPEIGKIVAMSSATGGLLANASGLTPDNVATFAPYLSHVLVATGVALDEYRIDPTLLKTLIGNAVVVAQPSIGEPHRPQR